MTPALRDAIHANTWLLTAAACLVVGAVLIEPVIRDWFTAVAELIEGDPYDQPADEPDPFDPTNHRANHPTCEVCRGIEARADHVWDALVAQLEGEQA
jgi:hypothetical protein